MPRVRQEVEALTIGPTADDPRTITLAAGDEVPDWALEVCSNPMLIDFSEESEE